MGLFDRCKREEFIEIDGEKVSLKGKTPDEIAKIRNDAALKASDYNDDEHAIPIGDLEQKLRSEFAEFDVQNYSLQKGLSFEDRKNLSGLAPRNKLTPKAVKPEWLKFVEQMTGFFALLLWGGSVLCFIGYGLRGEADNLYLGIVLAAVVFITGCFSYSQEAKSANLMAQFSKMMAEKITCQTDKAFDQKTDQWHNDNTRFDPIFLERGDIVLLKGGDNVPADCRLLDSNDFKVDNSPLTGEPDALERTADECKIADPKEATNLIFYGTAAKQGKCRAVVLKIGDDTFIGRIARLTASTVNEQTPINKEIHHFISIVSAVAITLGVVFFIVGLALKTDPITNLVFMIGIIVANVPEGLLATVTVCLTLTSKSMAAKSVLVKNMEGVETLGSTTAICSDKTGTLTQNKMTVAELLYDQDIRRTPFVQPDPRANYSEIHSGDATFQEFLRAMLLNTTASFKPSQVLGSKDNDFQDRVPFYMKGEAADSIPLIQWNTVGDASEASIIKLAQFMRAIDLWHQDELPSQPERVLQMHEKDMVVEYRREQDPAGVGEPVATIPFNSANKYHVVVTANAGNEEFPFTVWMKGAPERITTRCGKVMHVGKPVELTDSRRDQILAKQGELMKKGRRVLAFAKRDIPASMVPPERQRVVMKEINGKQVEVPETYNFETQLDKLNFPLGETDREVNGEIIPPATEQAAEKLTLIGMAALIDPPRPSVPSAVLSCQMAGVRVVMVTGDHPTTAAAIAKMVNIISGDYKVMGPCVQQEEFDANTGTVNTISADPLEQKNSARAIVVPGWEFTADTTDQKWRYIFAHNEIVFARTSPQQKLQIVQRFQQMEKEIVAVTGDGVNDAPALKKADIGVAMGIAGTEVSKSAADMILMDDNFTSIVNGVEEGRLIFDNLKKSIAYTLSSNIPEIAPFLIFITVQTPLPLSTVLILCIDLGTDMVPAISMAWENAESDIMRRPARDSAVDRLVTRKLVSFAYLQIGVIQAIAGFFTWFVVMNDYGFPPHIMPRLGTFDNYGKQVLYCQLEGGTFRNLAGETFNAAGASARDALDAGFVFWDEGEKGLIQECLFAPRNLQIDSSPDISDLSDAAQFTGTNNVRVVTADAIRAVRDAGYVEYIPWKGVQSPFWRDEWLSWDVSDSDVVGLGDNVDEQILHQYQPIGLWDNLSNLDSADAIGTGPALDLLERKVGNKDTYQAGTFFQPAEGVTTGPVAELAGVTRKAGRIHVNVASRMIQKEALHHAQCAYFVCIVIVQWADLLICKTRWLSIYHQGMRNPAMNFGLVFETILASALCYITALNTALGTRNLRALHWVPAVPFSISIFLYDEIRKYIMRATSPETIQNKQVVRNYGWLARQTYY